MNMLIKLHNYVNLSEDYAQNFVFEEARIFYPSILALVKIGFEKMFKNRVSSKSDNIFLFGNIIRISRVKQNNTVSGMIINSILSKASDRNIEGFEESGTTSYLLLFPGPPLPQVGGTC